MLLSDTAKRPYGSPHCFQDLEIWAWDDERTRKTRTYCIRNDDPREFTVKCSEQSNETVANIMLTQIHQLDTMLSC